MNENADVDLAIARVQLANAESDIRNMRNKIKSRSKATDTSRMNPVYKPKASPGPVSSAANVREGRVKPKASRPMAESYSKKNNGTRPVAESTKSGTPKKVEKRPVGESTKSGKRTIERKSWRSKRGD
jgi:hypothetical protein